MDTSPLASFCFSGNSNPYRHIASISGHNKIDTSISAISEKNYNDKNDNSSTNIFKKNASDCNSRLCFGTGSFKMSPTTSLAAEFSSNFYIDKSPVLPTPRRSLLLKFSCDSQTTSILEHLKDPDTPNTDSLAMDTINTVTPGSSSPIDTMDYSPLPYKRVEMAFSVSEYESKNQMSSFYGNSDKREYLGTISPNISLNSISGSMGFEPNILNSPSMINENMKIHSTSFRTNCNKENIDSVQIKNCGETCDITLNDLFTNSPNSSFAKPLFSRYSIALETSPLSFMNNDIEYRSIKWRRTQSLYQNSYDFFSAKHDGQDNNLCLQASSIEFNSNDCQILPCFSIKDDRLKRIDSDIFVKLLDGHYHDKCDEYIIVDCRFEYEYNGGHIIGAININTKDALDALFLDNPATKKCLIVFHCEYSSHRAPRLALYLRNRDRQLNMQRYPFLYYPEIYILHGGYRGFYEKYKERCEPQNYVEMNDSLHKSACAREMHNFRRNTKFLRTQTYTYGQKDVIHTNVMQKKIIE